MTEQIKAATFIHERAMTYMTRFSANELRSYLFFFDIVVQNGSIPSQIQQKYEDALKRTSADLTEYEKMKMLLEFRLEIVRDQFVEDVRRRKTAILDGEGLVHGSQRDFQKEFCVDNWRRKYR